MIKRLLILMLGCSLLWACSSPVNEQNYQKIKNGMQRQQVIEILGKPTDSVGISIGNISGSSSTWERGNLKIVIQFVNDKVFLKNYIKIDKEN